MRLTFLGVRGSTPAPGAEFVRYGGHTSCVAVTPDGGDRPTLALDAGTGLRALTGLLGGEPFRGTILLSHLHWDHVQGIPFFLAGDRPDARVDVVLPAQGGRSGRDLLAQTLSPPAFPITPEGLRGEWRFRTSESRAFSAEQVGVTAFDIAHKGGRTYGYRLDSGGASVAYLPDHAPAAGVDAPTLRALADVDVLIHDAQFVAAERGIADAFGHATVDDAVALAERVGARSLVLFHHGPGRTDDALDEIAAATRGRVPVVMAREGMVMDASRHGAVEVGPLSA